MRRAIHLAGVLLTVSVPMGMIMNGAGAIAAPSPGTPAAAMDPAAAARFAGLALKCLHAEYPNHISHTLDGDADARPPHVLNPAFYGCYDWHSDVHGHWLLVRLVRLMPDAPFAPMARTELARSLTTQNIEGEVAYDGLNLSRAWMLEGIAHGLRADDHRVPVLLAIAARHRDAALPAVTGEHYEGGHWLGTFAVYLTSGAGI